MARIASPDIEELLQNAPLEKALQLPADSVSLRRLVSVDVLCLSLRPANRLAEQPITELGQLLSLSILDLYRIRAMGRGSIQEIIRQVCAYFERDMSPAERWQAERRNGLQEAASALRYALSSPVAVPQDVVFSPVTLLDEWNLFSHNADSTFPIPHLPLSAEMFCDLEAWGVCDTESLLEWTLEEAEERLGEQSAEALNTAVVRLAMERRLENGARKHANAPTFENTFQSKRQRLEARWANTPVLKCGFAPQTVLLLQAAQLKCLGDVLNALEPLHPALCYDLPAFCNVWNRLTALELRQGDAQVEWERQLSNAEGGATLDNVLENMQQLCNARQWAVIKTRFQLEDGEEDNHGGDSEEHSGTGESNAAEDDALPDIADDNAPDEMDEEGGGTRGRKTRSYYTLEEVAIALHITRERVRQIEITACATLQRQTTGAMAGIAHTLAYFMEQAGGLATVADIAQELTTYFPSGSANAAGICHLLMEVYSDFAAIHRGSLYRLAKVPFKDYTRVLTAASGVCKTAITNLQGEPLVAAAQECLRADGVLVSDTFVAACLRTDERFSSELTRRDLTFLLMEVLRRIGKPAHFTEITQKLNELGWRPYESGEKSVGCRLNSYRDLFVYVGPGTYGLVEWGLEDKRVFDRFKNGYIGDIIEEYLLERDTPATVAEVTAYVLSRKRCQELSIYQRLTSDHRFHTCDNGKYGLKKWI